MQVAPVGLQQYYLGHIAASSLCDPLKNRMSTGCALVAPAYNIANQQASSSGSVPCLVHLGSVTFDVLCIPTTTTSIFANRPATFNIRVYNAPVTGSGVPQASAGIIGTLPSPPDSLYCRCAGDMKPLARAPLALGLRHNFIISATPEM